jgi:hypothetical protein
VTGGLPANKWCPFCCVGSEGYCSEGYAPPKEGVGGYRFAITPNSTVALQFCLRGGEKRFGIFAASRDNSSMVTAPSQHHCRRRRDCSGSHERLLPGPRFSWRGELNHESSDSAEPEVTFRGESDGQAPALWVIKRRDSAGARCVLEKAQAGESSQMIEELLALNSNYKRRYVFR